MNQNTIPMKYLNAFIVLFCLMESCQFKQKAMNPEQTAEDRYQSVYHFTPPSNWMNDPNGMVYYAGEYHLFYQHFPDSNVWGPMHWGHAVSQDMIHWEHLPIALYPDSLGFIFSGSAVVDYDNTTGFGSELNPAMVSIFTYSNQQEEFEGSITFQNQAVAYSLDSGRTWTKYAGNPVLSNPGIKDFRDPKVTWMEEFEKWVMILAVKDHVSIYSSKNLLDWTHESDFGKDEGAHGGVWECPDLFRIQDDQGNWKWVMLVSINPGGYQGGSGTQYFVGEFDGREFSTNQKEVKWIDYGADNYAGVLWSNIPDSDGRKLFIGWMSNWAYANKVSLVDRRNMMTIPREVSLRRKENDHVLAMVPIRELDHIGVLNTSGDLTELEKGMRTNEAYQLDLQIESMEGKFELVFSSEDKDSLFLSVSHNELIVDRSKCGNVSLATMFSRQHKASLDGIRNLSIFLDRSSIEVFANDGEVNMTDLFFTRSPLQQVQMVTSEAEIEARFEYRKIEVQEPI